MRDKIRRLPDPKILHDILHMDTETGSLFWKERPRDMFSLDRLYTTWNAQHAGKEAFKKTSKAGYKFGSVLNSTHYAHRIIWAMYHQKSDFMCIDHINGIRTDNRISNLREVTHQQNMMNQKTRCDSGSGIKGVRFNVQCKKWTSSIAANGASKYLGTYESVDEAIAAYEEAAKKMHGEYRRGSKQ